jgi:hypothetical protein
MGISSIILPTTLFDTLGIMYLAGKKRRMIAYAGATAFWIKF